MNPAKDAGAKLARQIFDRIDQDRTLILENIAEVCEDGLILFAAKSQQPVVQQIAPRQEVMDAAIKLIKAAMDEPALYDKAPSKLKTLINELYNALLKAGWKS